MAKDYLKVYCQKIYLKDIEYFLDKTRKIEIAKTNNRSVLGSMNDLAFQLKYRIDSEGGLLNAQMGEINYNLNRTPMIAIGEHCPVDSLKTLLNKTKSFLGVRLKYYR